jgi:hypothetical protein
MCMSVCDVTKKVITVSSFVVVDVASFRPPFDVKFN